MAKKFRQKDLDRLVDKMDAQLRLMNRMVIVLELKFDEMYKVLAQYVVEDAE